MRGPQSSPRSDFSLYDLLPTLNETNGPTAVGFCFSPTIFVLTTKTRTTGMTAFLHQGRFGEYLTQVSNEAIAEQQRVLIENARIKQEEAQRALNEQRILAAAFVDTMEAKMITAAKAGNKSILVMRLDLDKGSYNDFVQEMLTQKFGVKAEIVECNDGMGMNSWKNLVAKWD